MGEVENGLVNTYRREFKEYGTKSVLLELGYLFFLLVGSFFAVHDPEGLGVICWVGIIIFLYESSKARKPFPGPIGWTGSRWDAGRHMEMICYSVIGVALFIHVMDSGQAVPSVILIFQTVWVTVWIGLIGYGWKDETYMQFLHRVASVGAAVVVLSGVDAWPATEIAVAAIVFFIVSLSWQPFLKPPQDKCGENTEGEPTVEGKG